MIICGLKLTHDGGIALLEDEKPLCNIERENLDKHIRVLRRAVQCVSGSFFRRF